MRASWKGLELEFGVGNVDPGPGIDPDFCIEEVDLVGVDEEEFRYHFPAESSADVFAKHDEAIRYFLYQEAARQFNAADDGDRE